MRMTYGRVADPWPKRNGGHSFLLNALNSLHARTSK
jgi:hypothetical protein